MLDALPNAARIRVNDNNYSSKTKFRITLLHFPENIFNLCKNASGNLLLLDSIPAEITCRFTRQGLTYTDADRFYYGTYAPLPNIPQNQIKDLQVLL